MVSARTRRGLLTTAGAVLASAIAGCQSSSGNDGPTRRGTSTDIPGATSHETSGGTPAETSSGDAPSSTSTDARTTASHPPGTYADMPDGPEPYPARPKPTTPRTARTYAKRFEHVRTVNELYEPDVEEIQVDCRSIHDRAADGGQYVLATCDGTASYADGVHAEWGQRPALYFVRPGLSVRVSELEDRYSDCHDVFASPNPEENFADPCDGHSAAYRVYTLDTEPQTLTVTVTFLAGSGEQRVLERTYDLGPASGVLQGSVTYRRGTYRLTARLGNGAESTYRWVLDSEPTHVDPPLTVIVPPDSGVSIRRPPFQQLS